jgi:tRNA pseudouridine55 synthase
MSDPKSFGFLNVYKPKGLTSHDVVSRLRRVTKIKQIGHTGTLDPFATGVLPICIGKATRLIEYLEDDKEYLATVQFGANTESYDLDGAITETFNKKISKEELLNELRNFEGEISQLPPIYSAIKVNGKKLYEYARSGEEVEIKPRKVFISKIELVDFNFETQSAKFLIGCSKGTYIRSIAYDLGKNLSCGGYLTALERTKAGHFFVEKSIPLEELTTEKVVETNLIYPLDVMTLPTYSMNEQECERVSHGMSLKNKNFKNSDIVILTYSDKIHAVARVEQDKILAKKVFEVK